MFLLQNHFHENRFLPKNFIKIFWSKIFLWLQNHSLENMFLRKIFIKTFLVKKVFGCKLISSETIFIKHCPQKNLVENFLWLQNQLLEACSYQKLSSKTFCSKIIYGWKIISSKTGLLPKFSSKVFWSKIFYC